MSASDTVLLHVRILKVSAYVAAFTHDLIFTILVLSEVQDENDLSSSRIKQIQLQEQ